MSWGMDFLGGDLVGEGVDLVGEGVLVVVGILLGEGIPVEGFWWERRFWWWGSW